MKANDCSKRLMVVPVLKLFTPLISVNYSINIWKKEIWSTFMGSNFFVLGIATLRLWKPVIRALLESDVGLVNEILSIAFLT
jgi:hypothetical protein